MFQRYDSFQVKAHFDANGFLRDTPVVGRTGLLYYRNADGSSRTEYRLAEDAFDPESLASLNGVPILVNHHGLVTGSNFTAKKGATIGTVLSAGRQDGDNIIAEMVIHQKLTTPNREISCGYTCDNVRNDVGFIDPVTGVKPDYFQKNIRYNHVSLVPVGRAGSVARLNMDGAQIIEEADMVRDNQLHEDAVLNAAARAKLSSSQFGLPDTKEYPMPDREHAGNAKARAAQMLKAGKLSQAEYDKIVAKANKILKEDSRTMKLKLDNGLSYEVPQEVAVAYAEKQAKLDAAEAAVIESTAKFDACAAKAKADEDAHKVAMAEMQTKQDAAVKERVSMLALATEKGIEKADSLTNAEIKKAIIAQAMPQVKLDGMDDVHVAAYFDVAQGMNVKEDAADVAAKRRSEVDGFKQDGAAKTTTVRKTSAQLMAELKQDEAELYAKEVM